MGKEIEAQMGHFWSHMGCFEVQISQLEAQIGHLQAKTGQLKAQMGQHKAQMGHLEELICMRLKWVDSVALMGETKWQHGAQIFQF